MYEIRHYLTPNQKDVFMEWRHHLRDLKAMIAIDRRNESNRTRKLWRSQICCDGVWELRIDIGPGYRIYYAVDGTQIVLLLCGGDKQSQDKDIDRARKYWRDWQRRT